MRRSPGRIVLALLFALLGLNALAQAVLWVLGRSDDPGILAALQALIGASGVAAAIGAWAMTRWAPIAALGYGVATGIMLVALPAILALEAEARGGLWFAAIVILLLSAGAAWYLRRSAAHLSARVANPEDVTRA